MSHHLPAAQKAIHICHSKALPGAYHSTVWEVIVLHSDLPICILSESLHCIGLSRPTWHWIFHLMMLKLNLISLDWAISLRTITPKLLRNFEYRAVYTCIEKTESFVHSGFSWEVARQRPLNTAKNPNRKTHLRSRIFWNSAGFSGVFCQCNASSNLAGFYSGFSAESPDHGPRRNAHYTCTVKGREKSRMRTTYQKTSMRFGFFRARAFRAKKPKCYGFFWQCKRLQQKTQVFWILVLPM